MGQFGAAQFAGQQQTEEPGVRHIRGQVGRHLPFGVDPVGGRVDAGHEVGSGGQVVVNIGRCGDGGHFVSRCRIDCRLRYTGGNTVSKETFRVGLPR